MSGKADRDWRTWHREYDDPDSSLSRRLSVVRTMLASTLATLSEEGNEEIGLVSLCAGDGRDTLPVLAETAATHVRALLVELDDDLAQAARHKSADAGLTHVEVRTADAGTTASFADRLPCDVLMLCGVFGNIPDEDVRRTITAVPALLRRGGVVIWTRGQSSGADDPTRVAGDPSEWVREISRTTGLDEVEFVKPEDAGFRVGRHRMDTAATSSPPGRLFDFA